MAIAKPLATENLSQRYCISISGSILISMGPYIIRYLTAISVSLLGFRNRYAFTCTVGLGMCYLVTYLLASESSLLIE